MRWRFYECHAAIKSPLTAEILARISKLYEIEAKIHGHPAKHRK